LNIHNVVGERYEVGLAYHYHDDVQNVLNQWVDELTPGSTLKLLVPDAAFIAKAYRPGFVGAFHQLIVGGSNERVQQYRSAFDERTLAEAMRQAGLIDVRHYHREPGYLHMAGEKPVMPCPVPVALNIHAVITLPRLGFNDMWLTVPEALQPHRITLTDSRGAFWDQSFQTVIERVLAGEKGPVPDAIMAFDYDTVCDAGQVAALKRIMEEHPEIDAVFPLQSSRHKGTSLFAIDLPTGVESLDAIPASVFKHPVARAVRGHFGCTIIRRRVFEALPKPWFRGQPDPTGSFGKGRVDPDIAFCDSFITAGFELRLATKVRVGHLMLMIAWPDEKFEAGYQTIEDYRTNGRPNVG
jgi:hypothetical protein